MLKNIEEGFKRIWFVVVGIWIIFLSLVGYNILDNETPFLNIVYFFLITFGVPAVLYSIFKFVYKGFKGNRLMKNKIEPSRSLVIIDILLGAGIGYSWVSNGFLNLITILLICTFIAVLCFGYFLDLQWKRDNDKIQIKRRRRKKTKK